MLSTVFLMDDMKKHFKEIKNEKNMDYYDV